MSLLTQATDPSQAAKSTRSRSGCLTCRKRHQKCDESRPSCFNCQLRGIECGGYGIRLTNFVPCSGPNGQLQMVSKMMRGSSNTSWCEKQRSKRQKRAPKAPSAPRVLEDPSRPAPEMEDTVITVQTSPAPNNGPAGQNLDNSPNDNSLTGCAASSFSADACFDTFEPPPLPDSDQGIESPGGIESSISAWDEVLGVLASLGHVGPTLPSSSASVADYPTSLSFSIDMDNSNEVIEHIPDGTTIHNFPLRSDHCMPPGKESAQEISEPSDRSGLFAEAAEANESLFIPSHITSFETYLFKHFLHNLAPRFLPSVELNRNPYRAVYGHGAQDSLPLHNAILFASAHHLTKIGQLPNEVLKTRRIEMRNTFRDALQAPTELWNLGMTVLVTIVFDVIGTGMDSWSSKLIGCRRLLAAGSHAREGKQSSEMNCVRIQYNWMSTMGRALLLGVASSPIIEELAPIDQANSANTDDVELADQQQHWWANMPDYSMHLLLREATDLAVEANRLRTMPDSYRELSQLMPLVADLVHKIHMWQPAPASVLPHFVCDEVHFNTIWRYGLLCFVYHEIYLLDPLDMRIQSCVEVSLASFERLSWLQACLWPAFMIAVHARTTEARECYENRLRSMHTTLNFTAPLSIILVLKNIWETLDKSTSKEMHWKEVVRDLGMELNILL